MMQAVKGVLSELGHACVCVCMCVPVHGVHAVAHWWAGDNCWRRDRTLAGRCDGGRIGTMVTIPT